MIVYYLPSNTIVSSFRANTYGITKIIIIINLIVSLGKLSINIS